jgi:hypothetical protein
MIGAGGKTMPDFFEREGRTLFRKVWEFTGRNGHVSNIGDQFTFVCRA